MYNDGDTKDGGKKNLPIVRLRVVVGVDAATASKPVEGTKA